jgi:AcrR family transcriptional regulator
VDFKCALEVRGIPAENMRMSSTRPLPKSVATLFGVPEPPRNARERIVSTAIDLFYRHGFNAVGIDRILADAGVGKTTFYKYFAGKDDLMVEAVRKRDAWETFAWGRAVQGFAGDDPVAQLIGFFEVLDQWFGAPDFGGCMFINVALEFPNPNDPVHQAAAEYKRKGHDHYLALAAQAGIVDAETFADQYTMLLEGALILRQVHDRNDAARIALKAVRKLVNDQLTMQ